MKTFAERMKAAAKGKQLAVRFAGTALVLLAGSLGAHAQAPDVYITPDGGPQGVCTANPQPPAFFNNSANWGTAANKIGPGTTVHLCGQFVGAANSTLLSAHGGGTSGSPVIIKFESGTALSAPYWASGGAISVTGQSFITIDGGSGGIIQNTANGTGQNHVITTAIEALHCQGCEFKNLTIRNLYTHTSASDTAVDTTQVNCITFSGSNVKIHDNIMTDVGWCLYQNYTNDSGVQIYNNSISRMSHGIVVAGANFVQSDMSIYNNHFGSMGNWGTGSADAYHLTGIHSFNGSGGKTQNIYIYNNLFDGTLGNCCITGDVFLEGSDSGTPWTDTTGTAYMWNNVLIADLDVPNGLVYIAGGTNHQFLNNTMIGPNAGNGGIAVKFQNSSTNVTIQNNVLAGFNQLIGSPTGGSFASIDYNVYANASGGNAIFQFGSKSSSQLASWQGICGCDAHSIALTGSLLANFNSSTGVPAEGFVGEQKAVKLSNLAAQTSLNTLGWDTSAGGKHTPVQRPLSNMSQTWDIGAYAVHASVASSTPNAPSSLAATID